MIDKHTLRANALSAMRAAVACEWAAVVMNVETQKQPVETVLRDIYHNAHNMLQLQVDDELSKCHEALTQLYAKPTT